MLRNLKRVGLAAIALTACGTVAAQITTLHSGTVELSTFEWNGSSGRNQYLASVTDRNGGIANLDTVRFISGLDSAGAASAMLVQAQGTAQATSSALKGSALLTVANPVIAQDVVSSSVSVSSYSWLMESLIIGNAAVSSIRFGFHIDGTLTAAPSNFAGTIWPGAAVAMFQGEGPNFTNSRTLYSKSVNSASASFDDYVFTNAIPVVNGAAALNIQFLAQASLNFSAAGEGVFSAQSLFEHTASIVEVYAYDSTGAQVAIPDVRTSTGFLYQAAPVASVPEPEQAAMLLAGLGILAGVVTRRRAKVGSREVPAIAA